MHDWTTFRNPAHRLVVTAVRAAEQLAKAADRFLKGYRLTIAQFNFLVVLMAEREGIPQSRIGERLVVSRANVTGIVGRLKARGLVKIASDPEDSRVKRVSITPAGARLIERILAPYFREIDRIARSLEGPEMESAALVLTRLAGGL
ncbi:MAG: MarR family transcriptional regulator [Planctomycetes bacterium]|nr:MarR family transcriptional regulator [Planctomycetota bacterium]